MPRPRRRTIALLVLALLAAAALLFLRHSPTELLTADGMDALQAARLTARTGKLSTGIVRPLLTARLSVNGDGTAPDFAHAPLYTGLLALALKATHQTGADQGAQPALLVNLALYLAATGATYWLARRLFAARPWDRPAAIVATLFFALGGTTTSAMLTVQPALLSALVFALLLVALWKADCDGEGELAESAGPAEASRVARRRLVWTSVAGALLGLLFLTLYSALLLLPVLLVHVYRSGGAQAPERRAAPRLLAFLAAALVVSSPLLVRNLRLAHNPLYNAHFADLLTDTPTFPGGSLLGVTVAPRSFSQYLAHGGLGELVGKAGRNVAGTIAAAPVSWGLLITPLFLVAALTRFPDRRVGRLRTLVYVCLGCLVVGRAPFASARESANTLLVFAPFAAALASGLLFSLIASRRLPEFYARAALWGWTAIGCLPGVFQIVAAPPTTGNTISADDYRVFAALNTDPRYISLIAPLRASGAYLLADAPAAAAYRLDLPILALPGDASDMRTVEQRTGRAIGAILLTPVIGRSDPADPSTTLWLQTYDQIVALNRLVPRLDAELRQPVVQSTHLFYPDALAPGMVGFGAAKPFAEAGGKESLLFLNNDAIRATSSENRETGGTLTPVSP